MDVVYVCRPDRQNEALRYSLRSLVNLSHDRVWIAGSWPGWVRGVELVEVPPMRSRYAATTANLVAACERGVSDRFVLMMDDVFVMSPLDPLPVWHRGPIEDVANAHSTLTYSRSMRELATWLRGRGHADPLCYETHAPIELEVERLLQVLSLEVPPLARDAHKRSLYGNVFRIGGEQTQDFKVFGGRFSTEWPVLSTLRGGFVGSPAGAHIRRTFPDPGPYEEA